MKSHLKQRIDDMILNGQEIRQVYDLANPVDQYILERMAYFKYAIPKMRELGSANLTESEFSDCMIDMYMELKSQAKIHTPTL